MIALVALTWPNAIGLMAASALLGAAAGMWLGSRMR